MKPQAKACGFFLHVITRRTDMLLGLGSIETALPYWLCILSTIGCIAYGIKNWNNAGEPDTITAEVESIVCDNTKQ
jgi:hypothetical protein